MPIVAHNDLPAFARLRAEGQNILDSDRALSQDIRELHIGLLNMMPDAALEATERQFLRLVGQSNQIAQFHVHLFSLLGLDRGEAARAHLGRYYETFESIRAQGLDALIITGANVTGPDLSSEPFWEPLIEVVDWAFDNVTSTLCSCLATHAVMQFRYGQRRRPQPRKIWGVFPHRVVARGHPLVSSVNTRFDVPHSRFNDISRAQFQQAGLQVLAEGDRCGVHLAVSADGIRLVLFQGHPEYDTISLLKELKREVRRYAAGARADYPPYPEGYLGLKERAVLDEYRTLLELALDRGREPPVFPEARIIDTLNNTWHDTAEGVVGNWMGLIYNLTHSDRRLPFMDDVDPARPLRALVNR
jgi:homoserine O-succinyltransferase